MDREKTSADEKTLADLGLIGIVAGVIVGPVGCVLGALGLRRAQTTRARRFAIAAIVVGVLQTLVVGALVWGWASGPLGAGVPEKTGVPPKIVVGGETVAPTYTPRPSPVYTPPATPSEPEPSLAPDTVPGGFTATDVRPDDAAASSGAIDAVQATYSGPRDSIELRQSQWGSPGDAQQYAESVGADSTGTLVKTGTVGVPPEGQYWFYDDNGQSTMVWTQGSTMGVATGASDDVQAFYIEIIARS